MRKIITAVVGVFLMMLASAALASESAYPDHLNGNPNYIFCDGHMGYGSYIDRSSLNVQQYKPPIYIIAVNVVTVPDADMGKTKISDVRTYYFLYKYDVREMYIPAGADSDYDWSLVKPRGSYAETGTSLPVGEIAFYLAYHLRFYGERAGFDQSFYNRI